jgi:hypothetical protein
MTKQIFNLRNVATIVACLAVTTMFAACDKGNNDPDNGGGEVKVQINNLPPSIQAGDGCLVYTVAQKPVQWRGFEVGAAGHGMITAEYPVTSLVMADYSNYNGDDAYLYLQFYTGVLAPGIYYQHYISKNKVMLIGNATNIFDFNTDFEILHEFGGNQGILRIEGVPQEYRYGIDVFEIFDYSGTVEDIEDYSALKPVGFKGDPEVSIDIVWHDYLAIPLLGIKNQHWDDVADIWQYEFTGNRFNLSGTYLIQMSGFSPESNLQYMYYAESVKFTNGRATIKWGDIRFIAN